MALLCIPYLKKKKIIWEIIIFRLPAALFVEELIFMHVFYIGMYKTLSFRKEARRGVQ